MPVRLSLRSKLFLLALAGLSSIGINVGGKVANAGPCGTCISIYRNGQFAGYGCTSGGQGVCTAGVNYCSIDYRIRCS
jgi:hypothetical protein